MAQDASLSTKTSAIKYLNGDKKYVAVSSTKKKYAKKQYNKAVKEYGKAICKQYIG
jgi:hypothetical protein